MVHQAYPNNSAADGHSIHWILKSYKRHQNSKYNRQWLRKKRQKRHPQRHSDKRYQKSNYFQLLRHKVAFLLFLTLSLLNPCFEPRYWASFFWGGLRQAIYLKPYFN